MPTLKIDSLPDSIDAFVSLRDALAQSPEGGAATFVVALMLYSEDQALGGQCLTVAADRARLQESASGYKGWELARRERQRLDERIRARPHIARSYVQGTSPESGYRLPAGPLSLEISDNPHSGDKASGRYKVFVASTGADSARPITLQQNNRGLWKASEWSSLTSGVRAPVAAEDDDL